MASLGTNKLGAPGYRNGVSIVRIVILIAACTMYQVVVLSCVYKIAFGL